MRSYSSPATCARRLPTLLAVLLVASCVPAAAGPQARFGPYTVELGTNPAVIPLGRAKLLIRLTNSAGKPVTGAHIRTLAQMPGMPMGEREQPAAPESPGVYAAPAQFGMAGGYDAAIQIDGPLGRAAGKIPIATGQNVGPLPALPAAYVSPAQGPQTQWILLAFAVAALAALWRLRSHPAVRKGMSRGVLGPLLLIAVAIATARFAVEHYRRPGAMTPLEAQGMEMTLPAPAGSMPVELATAAWGAVTPEVTYSGQAVGFAEQDISARVTGVLLSMPLYAGDQVRRGQVIARLDTTQSRPQAEAQAAGVTVAAEGESAAAREYQQSRALVGQAEAEVGMKRGAIDAARAEIAAARDEKAAAGSALEALRAGLEDATSQVDAARADALYWRDELQRERALFDQHAVTRDEFQREQAQAASAASKLQGADSRVLQARAQIIGAQANLRKADAAIAGSAARLRQALADLNAHHAHVRSQIAASEVARQKIRQAHASLQQARQSAAGARASEGYSTIRAESDGVVTQRVISPGTLVNPGQTIVRMAKISPIRIQANVAQEDLKSIRVGAAVTVMPQGTTIRSMRASVTSISPSIDPMARTGIVETLLPNGDRSIVPGQFFTMQIAAGRDQKGVLVPSRAITYGIGSIGSQDGGAEGFLWVAEPADGAPGEYTVHREPVRPGAARRGITKVAGHIAAGARVVTTGQENLHDGDTVTDAAGVAARTNR